MKNKKEYKPVKFTVYEQRVFELGIKKEQKGPEAEALRKMIDNFPFLTIVAECKFDQNVANAALVHHQTGVMLEKTIEQWRQKP